MLIFPTSNAFLRQHKIGVTDALLEFTTNNNIPVRVLMPKSDFAMQTIDSIEERKNMLSTIIMISLNLDILNSYQIPKQLF